VVHSAFNAAANIVFPGGFVLSLNAGSSAKQPKGRLPIARMPNGLQLSAAVGTFPFTALRTGMPVLFGAQRLHIEAISCSLDLSLCSQWNPHIEHPTVLDMEIVRKNRKWLSGYTSVGADLSCPAPIYRHLGQSTPSPHQFVQPHSSSIRDMAQSLCGRGVGLTPAGDDILAGWMAAGWLLYGPVPGFLDACQQIVEVARRQTHLLSQCWLSYAAEGNVAQPIRVMLDALTCDDAEQLGAATEAVLAMGATSGHDVIQGILLMLNEM
jgi:Protein of unknown function (DUF2877)